MVQINFAQKEIQCKIVYYGPGMSGKTTNLELVHGKVPSNARGELTSIATTGERTLYFDYMPLDLGQIAGINTKFQLYTVPGQIYYKSTRRLVLQGVDGVVFVADSSRAKLRENKESLSDLEENLQEMGKGLKDLPIVIQYNKRDLPDAMPVEELEKEINPNGFPYFEGVATKGDGVFPTLKHLAGMVLENVNQGSLARTKVPAPRPVAPAPKPSPEPVAVGAGSAQASATQAAGAPAAAGPSAAAPATQDEPTSRPVSAGPPPGKPPRADTPIRTPNRAPKPSSPPQNYEGGRALEDRMVKVSGLGGGDRNRLPILLLLLGLIGGAVFFAVSCLL